MLRGGGGVTFTIRVLGMETANNNNLLSAVFFYFSIYGWMDELLMLVDIFVIGSIYWSFH